MATNSSILAWEIPHTEEPGGLHEVAKELDMQEPLTNSVILNKLLELSVLQFLHLLKMGNINLSHKIMVKIN